ncbi:MAG: hypothetical protein ABL930_10575, partial [Pseudobdellovibrio sp.]
YLFYLKQTSSSKQDQTFTVLAVGESTTADTAYGSWPQSLQKKLDDSGLKARVVNVGVPGTNTTIINSKMPTWVEQYSPSLLITMMGINDQDTGLTNYYGPISSNSILRDLRIIKIITLLAHKISQIWAMPTQQQLTEKRSPLVTPEMVKLLKEKKFSEFQSRYGALLEPKSHLTEIEKVDFYSTLLKDVDEVKILMTQKEFGGLYEFGRPLLPVIHKYVVSRVVAGAARNMGRADDCKIILKNLIETNVEPSSMTLLNLASCSGEEDLLVLELFKKWGLSVGKLRDKQSVIKENYLKLYEFVKKQNICWIVMQYPLRDVRELESLFVDASIDPTQLFFVSNKENFAKSLKHNSFDQIFSDNFAKDFGHTKEIGNELLSSNVAMTINQIIQKKYCGFRDP